MALRQCNGRRRRDLELGLCRWTTLEDLLGIWKLCGVKKGLDERIAEGVLRWFGHVEMMEKDRIAKRVYIGECADIVVQWVGRGRDGLIP